VRWLTDGGSDDIEPDRLDRVGHLGTFTTNADLSHTPAAVDGPQAYLAIQGGETEPLRPHFHGVEQFQFFAHGRGRVGRHDVAAGIVQYADRHTPYGPLAPAPEGMSYLTLRGRHDTGVHFMPESRDELADVLATADRPAADRRTTTVDLRAVDTGGAGGWCDVVADADGLRIAVTDHPGAFDPGTVGGAGAYVVVVAGELAGSDGPMPAGTFAWCPPGDEPAIPPASDCGARVALLQFPR
jgi:hypothetical protein